MPAKSKRKRRKTGGARRVERVAMTEEAVATVVPMVPILRVPVGGNLTLEVDVTNPSNDYTVQLGNTTIMFARVDRRETVPTLLPGRSFLTWHFVHENKEWAHLIRATSSSGDIHEERRSEEAKDPPRSTGIALVVVS